MTKRLKWRSPDEVRAAYEKWKGSPLTDTHWEWLVEERFVGEVIGDGRSIEWLDEETSKKLEGVQRVASSYADPASTPATPSTSQKTHKSLPAAVKLDRLQLRNEALAAAVALWDRKIRRFRSNVLRDELLTAESVHDWLDRQAYYEQQAAGGATGYLTQSLSPTEIAASSEHGIAPSISASRVEKLIEFRPLHIRVPDGSVESKPTVAGWELDMLRKLAGYLAGRYNWSPEDAALFVLTGAVPNTFWPQIEQGRDRAPAPKSLELVIFVHSFERKHGRPHRAQRQSIVMAQGVDGKQRQVQKIEYSDKDPDEHEWERWRELRRLWNDTHPSECQFVSIERMQKDYRRVCRQLLSPK